MTKPLTSKIHSIFLRSDRFLKLASVFLLFGFFHLPIARSHHVVSDDIDPSNLVTLSGHVVLVEWINPHVVMHLEVENEYGVPELWLIQADTPNSLLRRGINRRTFEPTIPQVDFEVRVFPSLTSVCNQGCLGYGVSIVDGLGRTLPLNVDLYELLN